MRSNKRAVEDKNNDIQSLVCKNCWHCAAPLHERISVIKSWRDSEMKTTLESTLSTLLGLEIIPGLASMLRNAVFLLFLGGMPELSVSTSMNFSRYFVW